MLFFSEISPRGNVEDHLRNRIEAGFLDTIFQTNSSEANGCIFLPCGVREAMSWATMVLQDDATEPTLHLVQSAQQTFSFGWQEKKGKLSERARDGRDMGVDSPLRSALFLKGYYIFQRPDRLPGSQPPLSVRTDVTAPSENSSHVRSETSIFGNKVPDSLPSAPADMQSSGKGHSTANLLKVCGVDLLTV